MVHQLLDHGRSSSDDSAVDGPAASICPTGAHIESWRSVPEANPQDRMHLMPIITPAFPSLGSDVTLPFFGAKCFAMTVTSNWAETALGVVGWEAAEKLNFANLFRDHNY